MTEDSGSIDGAAGDAADDRLAALEAEWRADGTPFARATVVRREPPVSAAVGDQALVTPEGELEGWIGGAACAQDTVIEAGQRALSTGEPVLIGLAPDPADVDRPGLEAHPMTCHSGGTLEVFVEPVVPTPGLLIIGRSPAARRLARLAETVGMAVTIVDPEGDRHGNAAVVTSTEPGDIAAAAADARYVVVASMGAYDARGVAAGVLIDAPYIALIASGERAATVFERAADHLGDDADVEAITDRVTAPAGIDIGAKTPDDIAVSVLAELVERRRRTDTAIGEAPAIDDSTADDAVDPVCGMTVEPEGAAATIEHDGATYYFCCQGCADTFEAAPADYLQEA